MENKPHKLFISHSSKDAEYMKAFVDLLVAIGVHKNQITCTSVPQCNIPVGCNIYDWLAKQFQTSDLHVVYAFSDNYYSSVATLNEMGAAWVMRCKWTGLLLPGFIFDKLAGCIDKNQICIKLDDPDIITLKQRQNGIRHFPALLLYQSMQEKLPVASSLYPYSRIIKILSVLTSLTNNVSA